jgi:hypothetical protein
MLVEVTVIARRKTLKTLVPNYVQEFDLRGRGREGGGLLQYRQKKLFYRL